MVNVGLLLAEGFEELEAVSIATILRRAQIEVPLIACHHELWVRGARNVGVRADVFFSKELSYSGVVIPGGLRAVKNLMGMKEVGEWLKGHAFDFRAAICAAPMWLKDLGIISETTAYTCYPALKEEGGLGHFCDLMVVKEGSLMTSQGPATAMAFSLALVKALRGEEEAKKVAEDLLYRGNF